MFQDQVERHPAVLVDSSGKILRCSVVVARQLILAGSHRRARRSEVLAAGRAVSASKTISRRVRGTK